MIIWGIDPGLQGGIASILTHSEFPAVLSTWVMPTEPRLDPEDFPADHKRTLDIFALENIFRAAPLTEKQIVYLEHAQAMPGQGVVSMFNYGQHFGELLAFLKLRRLPYRLVRPVEWTDAMHLGTAPTNNPKKRSIEVAKRIFPNHNFKANSRCTTPHLGKIDAAMLAEFGRRQEMMN